MSEGKPDNPPAFPRNYRSDGHNGMWLRDYFAGQALAGLYTQPSHGLHETDAEYCYRMADAMLAERAKAKEE